MWNIAALRAEVGMVQHVLVEMLAKQTGKTYEELWEVWQPVLEKEQRNIYREAMERCGLPPDLPEDPA
jgi:hypothetical protein